MAIYVITCDYCPEGAQWYSRPGKPKVKTCDAHYTDELDLVGFDQERFLKLRALFQMRNSVRTSPHKDNAIPNNISKAPLDLESYLAGAFDQRENMNR